MSTSSAISSLQQALNCAGKCDCCDKLQQQINAINAKLNNIKPVDENALKTSIKSSLEPGIASAVAGGVAVAVNKLQPQIDASLDSARQALNKVFNVETTANNAQSEALRASAGRARIERDTAEALRIANRSQYVASQAEVEAHNASNHAGTSVTTANNAFDEAVRAKNQVLTASRQADNALDIARKASLESNLATNIANQADFKAGNAVNRALTADNVASSASAKATSAVTTAAETSKTVLNTTSDVTGLRATINNIGGKVNALGESIAKLELAVGNAVTSAAKAVGISSEALAATGRLAGKVVEIFNIIGTFAVLFEQVATLNVLGGRIDAVESGVLALGADVSRILGKLLGLQNRIGGVEVELPKVKALAEEAKGIGVAASLKAGAAQVTATRAENFAEIANANAKTAQTTADGAVRNAKIANDNAVIAYSKANEATGNANKAIQDANNATKKANEATNKAGEALGKAFQGLALALTALSLYQVVRSLRGLPGIPGRNGRDGLPGRDGITTVVQLPGTPGRDGLPGRPGSNGINGINGRDGVDAVPYDDTGLRLLVVQQHAETRATVNATTTGLFGSLQAFIAARTSGITSLIETVARNTYVDKAVQLLTLAATLHNALMLSNNLGQTLGGIVNTVLGLILPKGFDGTPLNINEILGKTTTELITLAIGSENYTKLTEDWAKANRIYQATTNVFNSLANFSNTIISGLEIIGGTVGKIGNSLRKWGVVGSDAFQFFNPQPNFHNKLFVFLENANNDANTIQNVVNVPVSIGQAATDLNNSTEELKKSVSQNKDAKPGTPVPNAELEKAKQDIADEASKGILLHDFFDTSSLMWLSSNDGGTDE